MQKRYNKNGFCPKTYYQRRSHALCTRTITNLFYCSGVPQGSSRGRILFVLNQMFQRKLLEDFWKIFLLGKRKTRQNNNKEDAFWHICIYKCIGHHHHRLFSNIMYGASVEREFNKVFGDKTPLTTNIRGVDFSPKIANTFINARNFYWLIKYTSNINNNLHRNKSSTILALFLKIVMTSISILNK